MLSQEIVQSQDVEENIIMQMDFHRRRCAQFGLKHHEFELMVYIARIAESLYCGSDCDKRNTEIPLSAEIQKSEICL